MKKKNLLITTIAIFGLATITLAQVPSYLPTNGLVGWWPFNGNANDESGNGNNGTVLTGVSLVDDRNGITAAAYNVDGVSCVNKRGIEIPVLINQGNSFSVSVWFKIVDVNQAFQTLFCSNPHNTLTVGYNHPFGPSVLSSGIGDGTNWIYTGQTGNTLSCSNYSIWNHLVVVKFPNDIHYYINGSLVRVQPNTNNSNLTFSLDFGTIDFSAWGCYETLNGSLDDIGIWNRALTQQEITDLYNGCQLSVNTQPSNQTIDVNNNAQFVVGSSDPNATYQWQTDLGVSFQNLNSVGQYSGTTNDTLTVSNVTLSNNNQPFRCIISSGSCIDTSDVAVLTVNNNVGINEFSEDNLFTVFPNPAQSIINVKADSKLIGEVYSIYDKAGRIVLTGKLNTQNTTIELGNLSGGVYMLSVGENMKQTFKVIKE